MHKLRRDRRASKFPRAKRVIVGVIFRFRGSCRSVSRRSGGYGRCGGRRVSVVGDVGLVGAREAFNFAPSHGLLVTVGVVGDDMEVNSVHISSSGDGALVGFAIEGLHDLGVDGFVG